MVVSTGKTLDILVRRYKTFAMKFLPTVFSRFAEHIEILMHVPENFGITSEYEKVKKKLSIKNIAI